MKTNGHISMDMVLRPENMHVNIRQHERRVPCNGCTACCRGKGRVGPIVSAAFGDDVRTYQTTVKQVGPGEHLAHTLSTNDDGSCVYLIDDRCSIYARRPSACRAYDCRVVVAALKGVPAHIVEAARRIS